MMDDRENRLKTRLANQATSLDWRWEREYQLKGWGSIDLILWLPDASVWTVEAKDEIHTHNELRKAVLQLIGYRQHLKTQNMEFFIVAQRIERTLPLREREARFGLRIMEEAAFAALITRTHRRVMTSRIREAFQPPKTEPVWTINVPDRSVWRKVESLVSPFGEQTFYEFGGHWTVHADLDIDLVAALEKLGAELIMTEVEVPVGAKFS